MAATEHAAEVAVFDQDNGLFIIRERTAPGTEPLTGLLGTVVTHSRAVRLAQITWKLFIGPEAASWLDAERGNGNWTAAHGALKGSNELNDVCNSAFVTKAGERWEVTALSTSHLVAHVDGVSNVGGFGDPIGPTPTVFHRPIGTGATWNAEGQEANDDEPALIERLNQMLTRFGHRHGPHTFIQQTFGDRPLTRLNIAQDERRDVLGLIAEAEAEHPNPATTAAQANRKKLHNRLRLIEAHISQLADGLT